MKQPDLKANERELIKLIHFFSKRAQQLMEEGKLNSEHEQLTSACQNLETQLMKHASNRAAILDKRERLTHIIEDNAVCPKCAKADMLKKQGIATNELGWRSNMYRCRRCNSAFTWNRPNNPWDMVEFLEAYIKEVQEIMLTQQDEGFKQHSEDAIVQLNGSLSQLRPVLEASDEEVTALEQKEQEMDKMIHQFKNYLLIEKIKLDTFQKPEQ